MKAVVYDTYGSPDVLRLRELPTPTPGDRDVLIRTYSTTVTSGDWRARSLNMPRGFGLMGRLFFGISKPRQPILGTELSGVIESVGRDVTRFKVGDEVFAFADAKMGCHAEYKVMPEDGAVAPKPANLTHDQAAALSFGGTTALIFFRRAKLERGERVLINGASGGVGTAAVQLARHFGAHVTGVCSGANAQMVKALGADRVVDYTREDFTSDGEKYDVIMDTAGNAPFARIKGSLTERGRFIPVLGSLADLLRTPLVSMTSSRRIIAGPAIPKPDDLRFLARLAEAGELTPAIDRRFPFERMADAHRHVDTGRKKGNVVVTVMTV